MKGFKKDGKFIPTGNKSKSSLKKSDIGRNVSTTSGKLRKKVEFGTNEYNEYEGERFKCPKCDTKYNSEEERNNCDSHIGEHCWNPNDKRMDNNDRFTILEYLKAYPNSQISDIVGDGGVNPNEADRIFAELEYENKIIKDDDDVYDIKNRNKQSLKEKGNDDLVVGIIRAESGEMGDEEMIDFVLKHQDTLMQLQGSWGRTVQGVLEYVEKRDNGELDDDYKKTLDDNQKRNKYELISDGRKRSPEDIERVAKLLKELQELENSQYPDNKKTLDDSDKEGKSDKTDAQKFMEEYEFEFKKGQAQHYADISLKRPLTETELKRYKELAKGLGYQG